MKLIDMAHPLIREEAKSFCLTSVDYAYQMQSHTTLEIIVESECTFPFQHFDWFIPIQCFQFDVEKPRLKLSAMRLVCSKAEFGFLGLSFPQIIHSTN